MELVRHSSTLCEAWVSGKRILAARWGIDLTPEDAAELQRILDAADRLHAYHQTIRAAVSADERAKKGLRTI